MKTTTFSLAALSLLSLTAAQPYRRRHGHEVQHEKKDADNVVVYTTIIKTIIGGQAAEATAAPAAPTPAKKAKPAASSSAAGDTAAGKGYGFSYAPYRSDGGCKEASDIKKDFAGIGDEYSYVRIYGTACNQAANVLEAAKQYNLKIWAGIFDITQVESEANLIIAAAKNDWDTFTHITVGNELVNAAADKAAMVTDVIAAIKTARKLFKDAGFKGKVGTVDTLVAARQFPELCAASDVCAVNCHAFFDGNVVAADSGKFVTEQVATLKTALGSDQDIIVAESGWPWKGESNKAAVPSVQNQAAAITSLKNAFKANKEGLVLFTIYNDHWKTNTAAQFGAEQYWGMKGLDAPSG